MQPEAVPAPPSSPRARRAETTRARLVVAAREVFEQKGYLDARVADIAACAGLSNGSFYHYFPAKQEIFHEVALGVEAELNVPLGSLIVGSVPGASPHQCVRRALRAHLETYRRQARIMGVIEQVSRFDARLLALRAARRRLASAEVTDALSVLQQRGMIDRRLDVVVTTELLGSLLNRFPEMWFVERASDWDFEHVAEQLYLLVVRALRLSDTPQRR